MVARSSATLAVLLAAAALPTMVHAQNYPVKPIRAVVGFTPGAGVDIAVRLIAPKMSETLGQSIIVDNRAGAGGNIAAELVARAPADGYTLFAGGAPAAISQSLYAKLGYDALRNLAAVGEAAAGPHMLIVNPALPVKSVKDLIALAKSRPREMNVASSGAGNSDHFAYELFRSMICAEMTHIAYKGGGPRRICSQVGRGPVRAFFVIRR